MIPSVRGHGLGKLALALAAAVFVSTLAAENCAKQAKACCSLFDVRRSWRWVWLMPMPGHLSP